MQSCGVMCWWQRGRRGRANEATTPYPIWYKYETVLLPLNRPRHCHRRCLPCCATAPCCCCCLLCPQTSREELVKCGPHCALMRTC